MENARKVALVPQHLLSTLLSQQQLNPATQQLAGLDQDMQSILSRTDIPADVKHKQYSQLFHRFANLKERELEKPYTMTIKEKELPFNPSDVIGGLPRQYRNKGHILLQHLKKNPHIEWDERGQLIIDGRTVEHSNVTDLVHEFVRPLRNTPPSAGWRQFAQALHEANVPQEAIVNTTRYNAALGQEQIHTPNIQLWAHSQRTGERSSHPEKAQSRETPKTSKDHTSRSRSHSKDKRPVRKKKSPQRYGQWKAW